jgi:uncharacterized repeat protein (TIGR01451 family)
VKTNTATVTSSTDVPHTTTADVTVGINAPLTILKTGPLTYKAGGFIGYEIVVTNNGPSVANGVDFVDNLPTDIESWSWSVSFTSGSSVFPGSPVSGTGNIATKFILDVGGKATVTIVDAKTSATAKTDITNTAFATPPGGTTVSDAWSSAYDGPINPEAIIRALVVGSDDGCNGPPIVHILDPDTGTEVFQFYAYEKSFRGSVRVATGDVTGDGVPEIIVGPGRNRVGQIRVFTPDPLGSNNYTELVNYRTLPFGAAYRGGVEVAVGDVNGDGVGDIIAGQSSGAGLVRTFLCSPNIPVNKNVDGVANTPSRSFRAFPAPYTGGVMVTAGNFNGDQYADIAVGTNAGIKATVNVYDVQGAPTLIRTIQPIGPKFKGGVTLSAARYNDADTIDDLFVGAGVGGNSVVEVYSGATGAQLARTSAFSSFAKANARVFTAAMGSIATPEITDNIYGVKGLNGGFGAKGVSVINKSNLNVRTTLPNSTSLAPPLRIAPISVRVVTPG